MPNKYFTTILCEITFNQRSQSTGFLIKQKQSSSIMATILHTFPLERHWTEWEWFLSKHAENGVALLLYMYVICVSPPLPAPGSAHAQVGWSVQHI